MSTEPSQKHYDLFVIGGLQVVMLAALVLIGARAELGLWYYLSLAIAAGLMVYHQWLAHEREPARCFQAFLHNHFIGLVIFIAMVGACMGSGIFGVAVPLVLKRFGADPATASSIFLTTFTDIIGMGLMLFLATSLVL